ncbi:unnamed protein product, partial [Schistosoma margrebowiei]
CSKPQRPVKDKEGKSITEIQQQRNRWIEYFEELMNRPVPDIEAAHTDLPIYVTPPTIEETKMAISQTKSEISAGPENELAEALTLDIEITKIMLHLQFKKIWGEQRVPMNWKVGQLIKIPKKRGLSKCENYRGITLLSIPGKVFHRVLLSRMNDAVDVQLRDQQAGFRMNRSCTDQIAALWIIVEQSVEWNPSLCINFIDYEKAFDRVDRWTLWKLLRQDCQRYPELIYRTTVQGRSRRTGVGQGCLLSPFLFLLVVDWVMKTSTSEGKRGIQWTAQNQLDDLDFADDLAFVSSTHEQMQIKTASVAAVSASIGLNNNADIDLNDLSYVSILSS